MLLLAAAAFTGVPAAPALASLACPPARLAEPQWQAATTRREAVEGGLEAERARPQVLLREATIRSADTALELAVTTSGGMLEASPEALGWPANWRDYAALQLEVEAVDAPVLLEVTVLPARGRLIERRHVSPRQVVTMRVSLDDLPLAARTGPLGEVSGVRVSLQWSDGPATRTLRVSALGLEPRVGPPPPVLDRFGQRAHGWWPGKILTDDELRARRDFEAVRLAADYAPRARDRFGGWTEGPTFAATGFFRVEQDPDGRWWFVTPGGHAFWSVGTTGVRVGNVMDSALAAGREGLFEALPRPEEGAWFVGEHPVTTGTVSLAGNVHFYRWNVLRKYDSLEAWRDRVLLRWEHWGLNTLGAWCDELMLAQTRIPHTRFLRARVQVPGIGYVHGFPDVWDERWEAWVDAEFARETARERGNPWLVGYFVDNEAAWRSMRLLDMPADAPLRAAWAEHLQARHRTIVALNQAWGTTFAAWAAVRAITTAELPKRDAVADDVRSFEAVYADRYGATVRRLLRKHDPDHLYLGCRFVRVPPHETIVAAIGRHVDVLSVNCYSRVPDPEAFREWHRMSGGRPILIGEFHFPLESARQLPPPYQAFSDTEREGMLVEFIRTWAAQPWSLGCHWYQHADQPTTGRFSDGENQTVGLVSIVDEPYDHLVRAFQKSAREIPTWRRR